MGLQPGEQTYVGIYATNCVEYVIAEYACYNHSIVVVPLYDTLGPNACRYIINQGDYIFLHILHFHRNAAYLMLMSTPPHPKAGPHKRFCQVQVNVFQVQGNVTYLGLTSALHQSCILSCCMYKSKTISNINYIKILKLKSRAFFVIKWTEYKHWSVKPITLILLNILLLPIIFLKVIKAEVTLLSLFYIC